MDGIEAVRIIREEIGTDYARNIPIIALTANAIVGNEQLFLSKGFQAFISKPIEILRLDAVVQEWVRDKELEKEIGLVNTGSETVLDTRSGDERRLNSFGRRKLGRRSADEKMMAKKLDFEKGIQRFGGDKESYMDILRSFAVNTKPLLESMKEVTIDNLPAYGITIHGIKGSSRSICAKSLGDMAEALETAAKAGNLNYVTNNNAAFLEEAEKLIADLEKLLQKKKPQKKAPKKDKPDREKLIELITACEKYDMDNVDTVMAEIEKFQYNKESDLVEWLRNNVNRLNFKEIIERLDPLVAEQKRKEI
jgi:CheY-like chemotaxis protein